MNKYLKISNKGLLDIRLISLMGGSTKSNDRFKIGQFGTGLKYSLAFLERNNIDYKIVIDGKEIKIETKTEEIANNEFKILYINDVPSSITTSMGLDWKHWMIIRELYSNALDEGEAEWEVVDSINPTLGKTEYYIELTPEFTEVVNNWDKYFIVKQIPFATGNNFAIYAQNGPLRIYKQGILIKEKENIKSLFNYDIYNADINELREYKSWEDSDVCEILFKLEDKKCIEYLLENVNEDLYEGKIDYTQFNYRGKFNKTWKEVIGNANIIYKEVEDKLEARGIEVDKTTTVRVPKRMYESLTKEFTGIGALRTADKVNGFYEIHDEQLIQKNKEALAILEHCNYFIDPELKFVYGIFGDSTTLAKIKFDTKEILLSDKLRDVSLFDFITTLVEENEHYRTGFSDCTRDFQQHFINLYVKQLMDKYEVKI